MLIRVPILYTIQVYSTTYYSAARLLAILELCTERYRTSTVCMSTCTVDSRVLFVGQALLRAQIELRTDWFC